MSNKALVLGGGGSLGNAWVIGVIAGLFEGGLDVTNADLIIGTSAGSTAAAQITSSTPTKLFADILAAVPPGPNRPVAGRAPGGPALNHMERTNAIIASATDAADMRRRMGAAALKMDAASDGSRQAQWRAIVAARLPSQDWPKQAVKIAAVDAHTGEPVVFDSNSGVDLADAIAASTSSGAPYGIGDGRYIDGGYRRNENADLAAGYSRVLVLSPFGGRSRHPLEWGMQLSAQVDELRNSGSSVETIFPNSDSRDAFGDNMMDFSRYLPSARAGYDQGKALAMQLTEFWQMQPLTELIGYDGIKRQALPSNFKYGEAIYSRGGVEFIESSAWKAEAWVGGLNGTVAEGAGSRRRTQLSATLEGLTWHCAGNPNNHQIFCKHCVALALALLEK